MSKPYEQMLEARNRNIDGLSDWWWIKQDQGAWEGPLNDWITSHKEAYFAHVRKFDVVIQAGGNCGMYPRLFAQYFKWVYTFEPDPLNFYVLTQNCQNDNIVKMQAALGDKHGMIEVHRFGMNNVGMHKVKEEATAHIPQLCIDDLALVDCDLIQLDTEGYELKALQGAEQTIAKFKPVISVENSTAAIAKFLKKYSYEATATSKMDTIYVPTKL